MMLQRTRFTGRPMDQPAATTLSRRAGRWLWVVAALTLMTSIWMFAAGQWIDEECPGPCRVATLGGHHELVLALSATSAVALTVLAVLTLGFTRATPLQVSALALAGMTSLLALAGVLSFVLFVALIILAISGLARALH
jgi:hypothetical protein